MATTIARGPSPQEEEEKAGGNVEGGDRVGMETGLDKKVGGA